MMNKVVDSLRKEYTRLEREMGQVGKALDALGHNGANKLKKTGRTLSKDARRRIAEAQKNCNVLLKVDPPLLPSTGCAHPFQSKT